MMAMIRDDLAALNITHEVFASERALTGADGGEDRVREAIDWLRARGLVYEGRLPPPKGAPSEDWEDREQTLFRSTDFGDDVDRPLIKSDGGYTYFASDIAYHKTKIDRGFIGPWSTCGAPTTAATSSACRRRSPRCRAARPGSRSACASSCASCAPASRSKCRNVPETS